MSNMHATNDPTDTHAAVIPTRRRTEYLDDAPTPIHTSITNAGHTI